MSAQSTSRVARRVRARIKQASGEAEAAESLMREASELAATAGLPVERLVAHAALDAISGHEAVADPSAPSAATMAPTAIEGAARLLTDLGLVRDSLLAHRGSYVAHGRIERRGTNRGSA